MSLSNVWGLQARPLKQGQCLLLNTLLPPPDNWEKVCLLPSFQDLVERKKALGHEREIKVEGPSVPK